MSVDPSLLLRDFPLLVSRSDLVYLDNAATTQKPKQVIDALHTFYTTSNANVHRGNYALSRDATKQFDDARHAVASFIGASFEEIVFTRGATESLNLLASTLDTLFAQGRTEIVLSEMEHHANLIPWQQLAKRKGFSLRFIRMTSDFTLDMDHAHELITDKTALLAVTQLSNVLGTIVPVKELCTLAREKGAYTVIDGAQSVAHMPVKVREMGCDFLVFSSHKMLGPTGVGVLYGRRELLDRLHPVQFGGDMIKEVSYTDATWAELPSKFEAGTPNIADVIAFSQALQYLSSVGMENIHAWEQELSAYAKSRMSSISGVRMFSSQDSALCSGILSFTVDGVAVADLAAFLDEEGICLRSGHHCAIPLMQKLGIAGTLRISVYLYNTKEDIDRLVAALEKTIAVLKK